MPATIESTEGEVPLPILINGAQKEPIDTTSVSLPKMANSGNNISALVEPHGNISTLADPLNDHITPMFADTAVSTLPIDEIYKQIITTIAVADDEIFQLELPGRVLDQSTYDYLDSDTINAQQLKPETVVDAEFRLSDSLYNVSHFTNGPNGTSLAKRYYDILYSLIAKAPAEDGVERLLHNDQTKVCAWLTQHVDDFDVPNEDILKDLPSKYDHAKPAHTTGTKPFHPVVLADGESDVAPQTPRQIPRVDLYQKLLSTYDVARFRWASFKRNARPTSSSPQEIDEYNRMLSAYAPIVDSKLESLWTVVLVRGEYHRIRRFIGLVDIESSSEVLQRAKENLRASVARSIDDTQDIYPVYFEPSNWAKSLNTSFTPQDLLSDVSMVRDEIFEKEKLRSHLQSTRATLVGGGPNLSTAQDAEKRANTDLMKARKDLQGSYTDGQIKVMEMFFTTYIGSQVGPLATSISAAITAVGALGVTSDGPFKDLNSTLSAYNLKTLAVNAFAALRDAKKAELQAQENYESAAGNLARLQAATAAAQASDKTILVSDLDAQIQDLTADIEFLGKTLQGASNALPTDVTVGATHKPKDSLRELITDIPSLPVLNGKASTWTEITSHKISSTTTSSNYDARSASNSSFDVSSLFWGASGSSSSSSAGSDSFHKATNTSVTVAFRCMKVTIDRPWLDTGIFKLCPDFYWNKSAGVTISNTSPSELRDALGFTPDSHPNPSVIEAANTALLPTLPTAFLVAKDVHIIYETKDNTQQFHASNYSRSSQSGGGFLFFASGGGSSSDSGGGGKSSVTTSGNRMSVKIPAPQIIGWFSQVVEKGTPAGLEGYRALEKGEFD